MEESIIIKAEKRLDERALSPADEAAANRLATLAVAEQVKNVAIFIQELKKSIDDLNRVLSKSKFR